MKFKHHLNEQNMAHFILLWLVSVTLGYFTPLAVAHHYPPPPPIPPSPTSPFTLFTDYLTIRVLNKNEVRKWFEDYRSCRTCWTATKIFCEGGSNKWEPRRKRKKVCVHFKINLHSFGSLVTKYVISLLPPCHRARAPTHLPRFRKTNGELKCEWGDVAILIHLCVLNFHRRP